MFNTVLAQSDDKKLRELTKAAIDGLMSSGTKTEITPFKNFNSVDTHNLHRYCLQKAYSSTDEKYKNPGLRAIASNICTDLWPSYH